MRINNVSLSADAAQYVFDNDKPITVFAGTDADLHLSLLGATVGNYDRSDIADNSKTPLHIIHADVEADGKLFEVCYIYEQGEDHIIGANFKGTDLNEETLNAFKAETLEYKQKVFERDGGECTFSALHIKKNVAISNEPWSESQNILYAAAKFLTSVEMNSPKDDGCPLFIYDFLERIDEAVDVTPWLDRLAALGRQVFIAVGESYPTEKLSHPSVQIIKANNIN